MKIAQVPIIGTPTASARTLPPKTAQGASEYTPTRHGEIWYIPVELPVQYFWSLDETSLLATLESSRSGLSIALATERLAAFGSNVLQRESHHPRLRLLLSQLKSPITLLLAGAAMLST
jgi:magnesium-transporting ATPase (P-type)